MLRGTGRSPAVNREPELRSATDIELMAAIAGRDESALAALYDRYGGTVFALCLRSLPRSAAEELVLDIFWELWERSDRFDPSRGAAAAYILGVARCRMIDKLRAGQVRAKQNNPELQDNPAILPSSTPLDDMLLNEQRTRVEGALSQLTPNERSLVDLAYFDALSQSEIAQHLGQPLGTIKTQIRKAMKRLRDLLVDKGE